MCVCVFAKPTEVGKAVNYLLLLKLLLFLPAVDPLVQSLLDDVVPAWFKAKATSCGGVNIAILWTVEIQKMNGSTIS